MNFFDVLILAAVAAAAYFFFRRRRAAAPAFTPAAAGYGGMTPPVPADELSMRRESAPEPAAAPAAAGGAPTGARDLPPGFDAAGFLQGAERAYRMLQAAWDRGDLEEIRGLSTDDVFRELQSQLRERHGENRTEVLHLQAQILEARQVGDEMEVSVLFDAFLREVDGSSPADARGQQVKEVWHFIRRVGSAKPTWFLDGIQQLS
jgi:predicted lipid-binding transport protein (Tim44 family)